MKQITRSAIFLSLSLCAMAEAGALDLSALKRSDLADVALSLPELRRAKRASGRTKDSGAAETELLVKFRGQKEARSVVVDPRVSAQALKALQARADVEYAEPNQPLQRQFVPSDALLGSQWHHGKIGSTNAWNWGTGSSSVKIAIVDAPFNLGHPDLASNLKYPVSIWLSATMRSPSAEPTGMDGSPVTKSPSRGKRDCPMKPFGGTSAVSLRRKGGIMRLPIRGN